MSGRRAVVVAALLLPNCALAEMQVAGQRYSCERGVEIAASYVNADDGSAVVLQVEGRQITLLLEPAASGARYAWPSGGAGYVWWTMGAEATLSWREAGSEERVLLADCRPSP